MVKPRAIVSIANVATKGGTLNLVMVNPLNQPNKKPANKPATTAPNTVKPMKVFDAGISMPFFNRPAVMAPHKANMEPTDRSMPAVNTINVMPVAMQMFTAIWRRTLRPLSAVKNLSDIMLSTMHSTTNAINDWNLLSDVEYAFNGLVIR